VKSNPVLLDAVLTGLSFFSCRTEGLAESDPGW